MNPDAQLLSKLKARAYQEGKMAGRWGFLPIDSPYLRGSKEHEAWTNACSATLKHSRNKKAVAGSRR